MSRSQAIFRLLSQYGLPTALALSAATSLTFLAYNTFFFEMFNNWFSPTHIHHYNEPQQTDSPISPDTPSKEEDKTSFEINLPPISVSPEINWNPNISLTNPVTVNPNIVVTPDFEINPEINISPNVEITPTQQYNPALDLPIDVQVDNAAESSSLLLPIDQPWRAPRPPFEGSPSSLIPAGQLLVPPIAGSQPVGEKSAPSPEIKMPQPNPVISDIPTPFITQIDNPMVSEKNSFNFVMQELPPELFLSRKNLAKSFVNNHARKSIPNSPEDIENGHNHESIPEPSVVIGIVLVGSGMVWLKLNQSQQEC